MNILLEGIIRLEPADTELQSSRSGLRIAWCLLGEGGGGGGGGGSFILKLLDHLIP